MRTPRLDRAVFVSIHAPLAGCDNGAASSTHIRAGFNPRTPRGVRQCVLPVPRVLRRFNPRTPRGVRPHVFCQYIYSLVFQSTHPSRGATQHLNLTSVLSMFQSTHPSRGATLSSAPCMRQELFQSTHPSRGATLIYCLIKPFQGVSIHAPLAGCDVIIKI